MDARDVALCKPPSRLAVVSRLADEAVLQHSGHGMRRGGEGGGHWLADIISTIAGEDQGLSKKQTRLVAVKSLSRLTGGEGSTNGDAMGENAQHHT